MRLGCAIWIPVPPGRSSLRIDGSCETEFLQNRKVVVLTKWYRGSNHP